MVPWEPTRWHGPRFAAYAPMIDLLRACATWPAVDELDRLLGDGLRRARPLRLVAQVPTGAAADLPYELAIADRGQVPTRPGDAHDLWNAIVWATLPQAKWALTARLAAFQRPRHAAGPRLPGARAPAHDRLALLDEGGLVVVGDRALVFGHAILEHAARGVLAVRAAPLALPATTPSPAPAPVPARAAASVAYDRGWDALRAGDFAAAAADFARVELLDPSSAVAEDAAYWYAVALARAGRPEAAGALHAFLRRHPRSIHAGAASAALGWLLIEAGRVDEAAARFRAAQDDASAEVRASAAAGLAATR